jgi:hypothetical protein
MTISFGGFSVTTWGEVEGQQLWRANNGERQAYFTAERDAESWFLATLGAAVLRMPTDSNAADLLMDAATP